MTSLSGLRVHARSDVEGGAESGSGRYPAKVTALVLGDVLSLREEFCLPGGRRPSFDAPALLAIFLSAGHLYTYVHGYTYTAGAGCAPEGWPGTRSYKELDTCS